MKKTKRKRRRKARVSKSSTKSRPLRSAQEYQMKPSRFQDLWDRVVTVISKLRSKKTSLQQTSREMGISPRSVLRHAGSALQKNKRGRYEAKQSDRLLRMLMVPGPEGPREVALRNSRDATLLGEYWNAVHRYLVSGDASGIVKFEGKYITDADGKRIDLLTKLSDLDRLGSAGVLSFQSLYARTA
jgi:hypothetical protein